MSRGLFSNLNKSNEGRQPCREKPNQRFKSTPEKETVTSASTSGQATKVTSPNQFTSIAGSLFVPPNMDRTKKYKALAVAHPFGGVKEQTAGTYARKMAEKGYVTLAFDASHQGESGGYPRDTENPAERMEDIRCAVDYLTTLPIVDEDRIGLLGVCAGGSYVMAVAPTEMRAKAIASVSLWDLRLTAREGWLAPQCDRTSVLVEIGKQRTAEARGLTIRRDDGIPPKKALADAPEIIKESYDYYRTPRAQHHTSRSVFVFTDFAGSWISTTMGTSKRSPRVRYCS